MRTADEQIVLITGSTDGLGRRVAEDLAKEDRTILLHGRSPTKGEAALVEIRGATGNRHLRYYNGDLSSFEEIRRLADRISADNARLDVLVNNAGIGAGPHPEARETSVDGFELRFAVNYLAPFLLTRLLLPLLCRAAEERGDARIVNVASAAQQALNFNDPMLERDYHGMRAYSQSKLALVMFTFDLARELEGSAVTVNALHPASLMDTKMVREWFGRPRTSVEEGARAVERLVISEQLKGVTGKYFDGVQRARASAQAYDEEARRRLRELTERWIAL